MMSIHAPDVSLTDFMIALLCIYFSFKLLNVQAMHHDLRKLFVGLFLSTAVAAGAGGAYHGFFEVEPSMWSKVTWKATLLAIGCAAFYLWHIACHFTLPQSARRWVSFILQIAILGYAFYVGYVSQEFIVAVAAYAPAVVFLLFAVMVRYFKSKDSRMLIGVLAAVVTIGAAVVQVRQIAIHPVYFNHNALYHVIQALGLYFFYRFALRVVVWKG